MLTRTLCTAIALGVMTTAGNAADTAALAEEGKALIMEFGGALKSELVAAMEAGGPVSAIAVCNERAPEIAGTISAASGWSVARSSHKLRNPNNAPDAFTAVAIDEFLARQAAGEAAADLAKAAIVEENGQQVFRLVKAIPTGEVCLKCHGGDSVAQPVAAKLAELYPDDRARGFAIGEMRGVFTLSRAVSE